MDAGRADVHDYGYARWRGLFARLIVAAACSCSVLISTAISMRKHLVWLLILWLTGLQQVSGQSAEHDWAALSMLRRGDRVVVERNSAPPIRDTYEGFDEDQINLIAGKTVLRQDIRKVTLIGGHPFGRSIAIGVGVGAGTGALLGAIGGGCNGHDWCFFSRGGTALIGLVVGVAFGAVAGTVVGVARHDHKVIYDRR